MTRAPLIFLSGALAGVCGTLLATHARHPKDGGSSLDGARAATVPRLVHRTTAPRLTWPMSGAAASGPPVRPAPTREECEKILESPGLQPGTPEFYRACASDVREECSFVDLDPQTLEEIARCGIFRSDIPIFTMGHFDVTTAEREPFLRAAREYGLRLKARVAEIGKQLGVRLDDKGSVTDDMDRIEQAISDGNYPSHALWRRLAKERAGLLPRQPADVGPPEERFWRLLGSAGDEFEEAIAAALGSKRAHELRLAENGWPLKHVGMNHCEGDPVPDDEQTPSTQSVPSGDVRTIE